MENGAWPADLKNFLTEVEAEVFRAREKFPSSRMSMAALTEEVGELAQALLKVAAGKWDVSRVREEAIQVAAMACRVATEGDSSFTSYTEPGEAEYYILVEPWSVYVKEAEFFRKQGGTKEDWGKRWEGPIKAASIEDARRLGENRRMRLKSLYLKPTGI